RLPVVPRLAGRALIRSQAPGSPRKYTAPAKARPSASEIPADIIQRFVGQHREMEEWIRSLDEHAVERTIMVSPFIRVVVYSILDGCRLIVAHDRRHFEHA